MKSFLFQRYASVRCNSLMIVSSLTIHDDPGTYKFLSSDPSRYHLRSPKVTKLFAYNFWLRRGTDMRIRLMCLPHQDASNNVQYDLFGSTWIMTRPWSEVKFWSWPFKVILYIFRRALTRETRWYKINFLPLPYQKLFSKSHFRKILSFWHRLPLESNTMTSPQIYWQNVTWVLPGLSYDFCWSVLSWFSIC